MILFPLRLTSSNERCDLSCTTNEDFFSARFGTFKTTPIDVFHVEAGVLPIEERFRLKAERKALRIEYGISPTNPIRNDRKCTGKSSPLDCIKGLLREVFPDSPPAVSRNRKPPWEKENTEEPGDTLLQELRETKYST
jgi:hypothetical protein